jgi:ABC-type transport system involved in multi-copper enzyme maturation permease subunit
MTHAILWKELREQAAVVIALVVMGCGLMVAMATLLDTGDSGGMTSLRTYTNSARIGVIMLTMTAGLVIGGTLFAGERESGTFLFLDRLPGSRWKLWWRKVLTGLGLASVAALILFATASGLQLLGNSQDVAVWALLIGTLVFGAFSWGCVGSTVAKSSLSACAVGVGWGMGLALVATMFLVVAYQVLNIFLPLDQWFGRDGSFYLPAAIVVMSLLLPLMLSAFLFTTPDRDRAIGGFIAVPVASGELKAVRFRQPTFRLPKLMVTTKLRRYLWLMFRQQRITFLICGVLALLAGCALLLPDVAFIAVWPGLSLFFGVLLGVSNLSDEQGTESARFWGERRLKVGGLWLAKIALGLVGCVMLVIAMLLPSLIRGFSMHTDSPRMMFQDSFGSIVPMEPGFPLFGLLFLGPVYGFCFGHFAAMLFRKTLVAGAVGLMLGGIFAAFWVPSLFSGGIHAWQLWLPIVVLLVTTRLSVWAWTTNTLGTRRPITRLAVGLMATVVVTGFGLAWRVLEVEEIAEGNEDIVFSKSLPSFDELQAGRDLRRAASEFRRDYDMRRYERIKTPYFGPEDEVEQLEPNHLPTIASQIERILANGYPANRPELDRWLDYFHPATSECSWDQELQTILKKPTGVVEDPNEMGFSSTIVNTESLRYLAEILIALGLRAQRDGNPAEFVDRFEQCLAMVRNIKNYGQEMPVIFARGIELRALQGLQSWIQADTVNDPALTKRLLAALRYHDEIEPYKPRNTQLAEQTVRRGLINSSEQWLPRYISQGEERRNVNDISTRADTQANLISFFWAVPWEKERLRRTIGLGNSPSYQTRQSQYQRGIPAGWMFDLRFQNQWMGRRMDEANLQVQRRAMIVSLALRLHHKDVGSFPKTLQDLVPKYLAALPNDPFEATSSKTFGYRVTTSETKIPVSPMKYRTLNAPQNPVAVALLSEKIAEDYDAIIAYRRASGGAIGSVVFWNLEDPAFGPDASGPGFSGMAGPAGNTGIGVVDVTRVPVELIVASGDVMLWSVGPDKRDDSAQFHLTGQIRENSTGDIVIRVPLPKSPPVKKP